ncbi:hypothetical protein P4132_12100 [Pseudomonas aeruginosa]|nr:hypothetical protein [Pseudomonas aeruginosa]
MDADAGRDEGQRSTRHALFGAGPAASATTVVAAVPMPEVAA